MTPPSFPDDTASRLAALRASAAGLVGALAAATALAESRRRLDLAGLDNEIGRLCAYALDLPAESGRLFRPELIALAERLEALGRALRPPA